MFYTFLYFFNISQGMKKICYVIRYSRVLEIENEKVMIKYFYNLCGIMVI